MNKLTYNCGRDSLQIPRREEEEEEEISQRVGGGISVLSECTSEANRSASCCRKLALTVSLLRQTQILHTYFNF
jgi:hypothetical protein